MFKVVQRSLASTFNKNNIKQLEKQIHLVNVSTLHSLNSAPECFFFYCVYMSSLILVVYYYINAINSSCPVVNNRQSPATVNQAFLCVRSLSL